MAKPTETAEYLQLKKRLFYFLKKEGVYVRYMENINKYSMEHNYPCAVESYIKSPQSMRVSAISGPFEWKATKEGDAFWMNIHTKWVEYAKTI